MHIAEARVSLTKLLPTSVSRLCQNHNSVAAIPGFALPCADQVSSGTSATDEIIDPRWTLSPATLPPMTAAVTLGLP
jgi:hypothetical protein